MEPDVIAALLPLALGHDQETSACPWVALTRQTADYPSRKAQAAIAVANGVIPATPDLVDLLFRCDHCGRCRAASILPDPPDLARALWGVRASFVDAGIATEVSELAERFRAHGSLYGDLSQAIEGVVEGDDGADVLFVPGSATLHYASEAAIAALELLRTLDARVDCRSDLLDSGQELREIGLMAQANHVQERTCQLVAETGYRLVIAGTPKEAFGLQEALADQEVAVRYAGAYIAECAGRLPQPLTNNPNTVFFHPSEVLLHRLDGFKVIDRWLACWLGDRYRRELDPRRNALPASIERPSPRVPDELTRRLGEQRLNQILAAVGNESGQLTILTCDPFSLNALRQAVPLNVEVVDLLVFATRLLGKEGTGGG